MVRAGEAGFAEPLHHVGGLRVFAEEDGGRVTLGAIELVVGGFDQAVDRGEAGLVPRRERGPHVVEALPQGDDAGVFELLDVVVCDVGDAAALRDLVEGHLHPAVGFIDREVAVAVDRDG